MSEIVTSDFSSIPEIVSISNNKLYIKSTFLDLFVVPFITIFLMIYYYLEGYNDIVVNSILIGSFVIFCIIVVNLNENYVIDFNNSQIYKEIFILGIPFHINTISINEISQFANNIIPTQACPAGKGGTIDGRIVERNPQTQYFHKYQFCCLSKTGKMLSIYFGCFIENFNHTIEFGKLLSEKWNIPFVECPEGSTLKIEKKQEGYSLIPEEIKGTNIQSLINLTIFLVLLSIFLFIFLIILLLILMLMLKHH